MAICSSSLFGYNLECTRRVGYGGLYAEMLLNRKFAAGTRGYYPVEWDGLSGWGQTHELLFLQRGKKYRLFARGGSRIRMRVLSEYGELLYACDTPESVFTSPTTAAHARFEAVSDGPLTCVSLRPEDHFHGCRRDVLDLLAGLHPGLVRFPGGCFAEMYNWKDGLLPLHDRPALTDGGLPFLMSAAYGNDAQELGIDDYAAICRYLGTAPECTVRLSENDPQDGADFVEYCNGSADTRWGALRAERGFPEPYNIRTWYVGNELAFFGRGGLKDSAESSAEQNDRFVRAMREVDPDLHFVASTGNIAEWDEVFLRSAKELDLGAHHFYLFDLCKEISLQTALKAADEIALPRLERARGVLGDLPMRFDEWNLRWGGNGDGYSALYAANLLRMLMQNAERLNLVGAAYFAPINEGAIRVYPDHADYAPDGEVLRRAVLHVGGEILPCPDLPTAVRTRHEGYDYYTICNTESDKALPLHLSGSWEILSTNPEADLTVTSGTGELKELPPASVAYLRA